MNKIYGLCLSLFLIFMMSACGLARDVIDGLEQVKLPEEEFMTKSEDMPLYDWNNLRKENGGRYYDDENYTSECMIDVSSHQEKIDWDKVKKDGVESCIIRIGRRGYGSEGNMKLDEYFEENLKGAKKAGVSVYGIYFFSQAVNTEEAKEEADFVLKYLKKYKVSKKKMVFYDLESDHTFRNEDLKDKEIKEILDTFAKRLSKKGYTTGVYTNGNWGSRYLDMDIFSDYGIWYARYNTTPVLKEGFYIWQYSRKGNVDGIKGFVDRDIRLIPIEKEEGDSESQTN